MACQGMLTGPMSAGSMHPLLSYHPIEPPGASQMSDLRRCFIGLSIARNYRAISCLALVTQSLGVPWWELWCTMPSTQVFTGSNCAT